MKTVKLRVERPDGVATERVSSGAPLTFGRAVGADVVCPDNSMSRRHARIYADDDGWRVEDLGSRNSTYLNGTRIDAPALLAPGDVIQIGATHVHVAEVDGAAQPAAAAMLGAGALGSSIFRSVAEMAPFDVSAAERYASAPARVKARLNAINEFHRALAGAISLDALLELMLEQLFNVLQPEEGIILLRQRDGTLATAASRRRPGATGDLLVSQRLTDEVVGKGTAALVTDVAEDARFAAAQSVIGAGIRTILAAPFIEPEGCLGMVAIYSRTTVRRFGEEDLELLVSLASAAALRIRNVALAEEAAARRVHDRELALAHDIQMAMLPRHMPRRPEIAMAASLIPARAVGGDLYDFLVAGDSLWFVVADAAGKGVSAALFMAVTRTLFRAIAHGDTSVSSVVERMNAELARDNEQQLFVTALVGRIVLASGELTICGAGHPPPLHAARGGRPSPLPVAAGIALGVVDEAAYEETRIVLAAGDTLLLFTDGVPEAVNSAAELFSDARLLREFSGCCGAPPSEIIERIVGAVNRFAAGTQQEDDITVMALRYLGPGAGEVI